MRAIVFRSFVSLAILAGIASAANAAPVGRPLGNHTRVTYPSTVSIEVLGRAMLYSVNFDQVVDDHIAVGAGFGSVSTNYHDTDVDTGRTASFIPVYMNYYFTETAGSPFVTGGVTMLLNHAATKGYDTSTGDLQIPSSSVMPEFGVGYEYRTDTSFLFRVTGYLAAAKSLTPWVGFSFGYAF